MKTTDQIQLSSGQAYKVKIRGQRRAMRRIFKWSETRFGSIPCFVFTSPVPQGVTAHWDEINQTLSLSGKRLPMTEVSVPRYDLIECIPA